MRDLLFSMTCEETYFFRGGTPFTAGEDSFLPSVFPPSPSVIQGVVRTAIMTGHGIDFDVYREQFCSVCGCSAAECQVLSAVGSAGTYDDMKLDITGPFLVLDREEEPRSLLFRVPADLMDMRSSGGEPFNVGVLRPAAKPMETDIGPVCMPMTEDRCKPLENAWLHEAGLQSYLKGEPIAEEHVVGEDDVLAREPRVGIARERSTSSCQRGMLYFIEHVRLLPGFGLGARVNNCPEVELPSTVRLGGEGRMSALHTAPWRCMDWPGIAQAIETGPGLFGEHGFKMVFLTPVRFGGDRAVPAGFKPGIRDGARVYQGSIAGIECTLVSMCADRPVRLGGWDMAAGKQKPRHSYIPAGSVYYFATRSSGSELVQALHDTKLGLDSSIGFGHVVIGRW